MKYGSLLIVLGLVLAVVPGGSAEYSNSWSASVKSSAELFAKHCASCHGKDGRSKTFKAKFNHARDLTDSAWQNDVSDERIFNSIMNGRGKKMPAYSKKLSQAEIDGLVNFVRTFRR